ncbi:MAG: penicillin-binding protein 2 [Chloroflexota bacterium]|nr:penicillin-binding protein 2 [Chloroflexota bacterium]
MTEAVLSNEIENQRRRLIVLFLGLCCAAAILVARLAYWQILRHDEMTRLADREHREVVTIAPRRGNILDRRGYLLATNITSFLVYGAPKEMGEPQFKAVADKVAPLLGLNSKSVQDDFQSNKTRYYVLLKRRVPSKVVDQVNALNLPGIHVQQEAMRVYPADGLAEPLLGFANFDAQGANGVEGFYNNQIRGSTGSLVFERDTRGREIAIGYRELKPAEDGANLNLTLDAAIQHAAEKQLRDAIAANGATGGTILILQVKTGAILASASTPGYDPNKFNEVVNTSAFVNPAVSHSYEPGSIFKIITMAAGVDAGLVGPKTTHNCVGSVVVDGQIIRTSDNAAHGVETMTEVLAHSCNVGAVYVSSALGQDRFYKYVRDFGFGRLTGVDLQGEVTGFLRLPGQADWRRIDQATNAFGQSISVTPLQMAAAVAAIANGGVYMKPYVVDRVEGASTARTTVPTALGRVVSAQTARTISDMLATASEMAASPALVKGYRIAGKTGTAQVVINGQYDPKLTITSFVGFAPVEDPQFVILIKIDKPTKSQWATDVAAPVFRTLAQWLLQYLRIPPTGPL